MGIIGPAKPDMDVSEAREVSGAYPVAPGCEWHIPVHIPPMETALLPCGWTW